MERRRHSRMRTLKSARILLNQHHSTLNCTIRNLSLSGACLDVPSAIGIPDRFDVIFDADQSVHPCRMVWHKETRVGVEFA